MINKVLQNGLNVLSFFDGMSCGQLALQKTGIEVGNYFACEIDKYAMKVAKHNFPNTIELGDVTKVFAKDLPKIDLFFGGSPCQGFSFAGKQLNFEDPRSKLFFEFVRMLNEIRETNPDVLFLLENVKMKKEFEYIITQHLGVEPVEINSNLVSAQNRKRIYWTNIVQLTQPKDKGIFLKDIVHEKNDEVLNIQIPSFNVNPSGNGMNGDVYSIGKDKSRTLTTNKGEGQKISVCIAEYIVPFEKALKILEIEEERGKIQRISPSSSDGVTTLNPKKKNGSQTYQQDRIYTIHGKMVCISAELSGRFNVLIEENIFGCITPDRIYKRQNGQRFNDGKKFYTLTAQDKHGVLIEGYIRKLTPIECERLQNVPDNYTDQVSNSQRYKMLGNGWTIDVITHIFSFINKNK